MAENKMQETSTKEWEAAFVDQCGDVGCCRSHWLAFFSSQAMSGGAGEVGKRVLGHLDGAWASIFPAISM